MMRVERGDSEASELHTYLTAALAVVGTIAANAWWLASTAVFANQNLEGPVPLALVLFFIVGSQVAHAFLWLIVSTAVLVSFRLFEEPHRVPRLATMLALTGVAHVPLLVASFVSTIVWIVAQSRLSGRNLLPAELIGHPELNIAAGVGQLLRAIGYIGSIIWLGVHVTYRWKIRWIDGAKIVLVPVALVAILLFVAGRIALVGAPTRAVP